MADPAQLFQPHPTLAFNNVLGHCLCKRINFTLHGPLIYHTTCHCANCRHATGSLIGCETLMPSSTLTITSGHSSLKSYEDTDTESGTPMTRQFCGNCGSQLFAITPLLEDHVSVFAGSWVRNTEDWKPMRAQFCGLSVVDGWVTPPKDAVRTVTGPLSQEMPASTGELRNNDMMT